MDRDQLINLAEWFTENSVENIIKPDAAISEVAAGIRIFQLPLFGFSSADDPIYSEMKSPNILGKNFLPPEEWLSGAKTVISFFMPFTSGIRISNRGGDRWPSAEWLHGRIEGQMFIQKLQEFLCAWLNDEGYDSLAPSIDPGFHIYKDKGAPPENNPALSYTSNWSERHAAFVSGLGTFGLSKGLITAKGIAGRFGSIITSAHYKPDRREYSGIFDYCSMCGACVRNCPVEAISVTAGKDHKSCSEFLDRTRERYSPRYGCGKCQVGVPCETGIPVSPNE